MRNENQKKKKKLYYLLKREYKTVVLSRHRAGGVHLIAAQQLTELNSSLKQCKRLWDHCAVLPVFISKLRGLVCL